MAEPLVQAASRLTECCILLAIGYKFKQAGILRTSDGETAIKVATTLTLPSVIVQAFGNGGPLGFGSLSVLGVASVVVGAQLAASWLHCMQRSARERAVLAGTATGLSLRLYGYPVVECFLGGGAAGAGVALQSVALLDVVNHLAVWIGSYLLFASAGPAFPEALKHEDGGEYRGQWRGMRKEGLGVYTYASGAQYQGEWRNNVKDGRGVYYFPKGGVYEGEWSGGTMNGLGVRTFSTGQVKVGRWRNGQLEAPLEMWQVALAADGATAVAAAARRVEVGGGRLRDAAHMLAAQPTSWALAAGIAVNFLQVPLPTSVDLVTRVLAQANAPLMLLAAGITAPALTAPLGSRQLLPDIVRLLGARLLVPLAVALNLFALAAAGGDGGRVAASTLLPISATVIGLLAPVPPQALANARRFRLNEATAAAVATASCLAGVPLMLLAGVAAVLAGLAAPPPALLQEATAVTAAAVTAATADVRPLLVFAAAALAAVSAAAGYVSRQADGPGSHGTGTVAVTAAGAAAWPSPESQRVRMVYAGPGETLRENGLAANSPGGAGSRTPERGSEESGSSSPPSASSEAGSGSSGSGGRGGADGSGGGTSSGGGGAPRSRLPPLQAVRGVACVMLTSTQSAASCSAGMGWTAAAGLGCRTVRHCSTAARRALSNGSCPFGFMYGRGRCRAPSALGPAAAVAGGGTATVSPDGAGPVCGEQGRPAIVLQGAAAGPPPLSSMRRVGRRVARVESHGAIMQRAVLTGRTSPVVVYR